MTRPVYRLDTENVAYERVGPMEFEFLATPATMSVLRNPRVVVQGVRGYEVEKFQRMPGPAIGGRHLCRFTLREIK